MPSPQVLADHYNISDYYTHNQSKRRKTKRAPYVFKVLAKLAWLVDRGALPAADEVKKRLRPGGRVLDLGAGAGETLLTLQNSGYEVIGIEPDSDAVSLHEEFPVQVYCGTGEDVPNEVQGQEFDMVICSHVMEHTFDPVRVLQNVHSLLKPGGIFLAEMPNTSCLDFRMSKLNWQHLGVPRHLIFWRRRSLGAAAHKAGFNRSEFFYRHYARQFSWGWVSFGKPMIQFYRDRGAYRFSIKHFSMAYYSALLVFTAFLPPRFKYDSLVLVAHRAG